MHKHKTKGIKKLEKVDQVITDTAEFQILNTALKGLKHVVIYLYNSCN